MTEIKSLIRTIPDFPKKGVLFRDITPVLKDPKAFKKVIDAFQKNTPVDIDKVVAIESRGFIFGAALALNLGIGFIPVRKSGKLPGKTIKAKYDLEYGTDTLEIHEDAIEKGDGVVLIDDLLATGGTSLAACKLIEKSGGIVKKVLFLVELDDLKGIEKLNGYDVFSVTHF
ncbi:MAG: adenine phosphoribosyltransferase [Candidatus Ratteibacteria bacterium]|nr:adenine phosphoribosyltransferase [Candidatus Ratteibacteria bacterium]